MPFDIGRFMAARFEPRTETVSIPELAEFFGEGQAAEWQIRGLDGIEIGRANNAHQKYKDLAALIGKIFEGGSRDKAAAINEAIVGSEVPNNIAVLIEYLIIGSVEPRADTELILKICKVSAPVFFRLAEKIKLLSGMGFMPGKQKPSGEEAM